MNHLTYRKKKLFRKLCSSHSGYETVLISKGNTSRSSPRLISTLFPRAQRHIGRRLRYICGKEAELRRPVTTIRDAGVAPAVVEVRQDERGHHAVDSLRHHEQCPQAVRGESHPVTPVRGHGGALRFEHRTSAHCLDRGAIWDKSGVHDSF